MALITTTLKPICVHDSIFNTLNFLYSMAKHETGLLDSETSIHYKIKHKALLPLNSFYSAMYSHDTAYFFN